MQTLRSKLEAWAEEQGEFFEAREGYAADCISFRIGAKDLLDLIWPVIEAAERIAKEYDDDWVYGVAAKALEQLNEKLKEQP